MIIIIKLVGFTSLSNEPALPLNHSANVNTLQLMRRPFNIEYSIEVSPNDTVAIVKSKIQDIAGFPTDEFTLLFSKDDRPWWQCRIKDGWTLAEYGVEDESEIALLFVDGRQTLNLAPWN